MRIPLAIILALLFFKSFSQNTDTTGAFANPFKWKVEKTDRGSLMFLDVAYQRENSDSIEYLTLTVAKDKARTRPEFISIIVPGNIDPTNGIFITFASTVIKNDNPTLELQNEMPLKLNFESCDSTTCTARVVDGFYRDIDGGKKDLFQKFMMSDNVLFLVIYPDGSHKSVAVPLSSFKEQYVDL